MSQPFWLKIVNQLCIIFLHFSLLFKGLDVCFQDVNNIQNTADEMELFALVNRKYKHFFIKQEHQLTFRTYDYVEVSLCLVCLFIAAHSRVLQMQKLRSPWREPRVDKCSPFTAWTGQNIAIHASSPATNFFLVLISTFLVHSP